MTWCHVMLCCGRLQGVPGVICVTTMERGSAGVVIVGPGGGCMVPWQKKQLRCCDRVRVILVTPRRLVRLVFVWFVVDPRAVSSGSSIQHRKGQNEHLFHVFNVQSLTQQLVRSFAPPGRRLRFLGYYIIRSLPLPPHSLVRHAAACDTSVKAAFAAPKHRENATYHCIVV